MLINRWARRRPGADTALRPPAETRVDAPQRRPRGRDRSASRVRCRRRDSADRGMASFDERGCFARTSRQSCPERLRTRVRRSTLSVRALGSRRFSGCETDCPKTVPLAREPDVSLVFHVEAKPADSLSISGESANSRGAARHRCRSAKPPSPVQIRAAPPKSLSTFARVCRPMPPKRANCN